MAKKDEPEVLTNPFDGGGGLPYGGPGDQSPALAAMPGEEDGVMKAIVQMARNLPKRDMRRIVAELEARATAAGEKYVYGWNVKNADGTQQRIEGPTVKLAMDLHSVLGKSLTFCMSQDDGASWTMLGGFADLETGAITLRPFRQRKAQNIGGKMDKGRQEDVIYQIGASKAMRNAVVNANPLLVDRMVTMAKRGLLQRIEKNPKGAVAHLEAKLKELEIPLDRVEAKYVRKWDQFTVEELALLYRELESIEERFITKEDAFPEDATTLEEKEAAAEKEKAEKAKATKAKSGAKGKSDDKKKTEPKKKEEEQKPDKEAETSAAEEPEAEEGAGESEGSEEEAQAEEGGGAAEEAEPEGDAGEDPEDGDGAGDQGGPDDAPPPGDDDLENMNWG